MNRLQTLQAKRMSMIQAKLNIGEPNDKYEQEADATASKVVQQINSPTQEQSVQREAVIEEEEELQMKPISSIQREAAMEEEEELQMKSLVQRRGDLGGEEVSADLEASIQSARGTGQPLDPNLQDKMGQVMGADFSGVKVHTDSQSDQLNKSIQAKAFTTGQDVFFRQGAYEPNSQGGQELIAHELTHVVQQNAGDVQRSQMVQRVIEPELVERFKRILELKNVRVVEVPKDKSVKIDTKFGNYPAGTTYGTDAINDKSLLDLNYAESADEIRQEGGEFMDSTAYDIVDGSGGGGYMHSMNMAMYNEGTPNAERAILHEMGHAKQNEQMGANISSASQIILEYHNVLLHENIYTYLRGGEGQELRLKYMNEISNGRHKPMRTWDKFLEDAKKPTNLKAAKNTELLNDIIEVLSGPPYEDKAEQIKINLVNEYVNALG
ncbi:MAG: DUF4157 domain-containing protein [Pseudanabaena sp. M57BS1SP1A06MG]|nr:DUF4157 domain-containing protein [Pseudanabaena sp. M53BS1SP1A06MG]MCA6581884.1 DUF4157 domain-containing protein [Pseudanabaena sp. M34BS1SP1A06MG]MCA6593039.1 DUF4157 domain-containing protein [Pseudanabaena sp. M38BS1SP1A06MG]MCA6600210.1 DUF4157 domain-containing protein [Pseudanabaena sp. M57BS1SP1A06MG]